MDGPQELRILVDGETFELNDLDFRERKEVRRLARVVAEAPSDAELEDIEMDYLIVAFITVCKQRTDKTFDIEDAMSMKLSDIEPPTDPPEPAAKARARRGAGGAGG